MSTLSLSQDVVSLLGMEALEYYMLLFKVIVWLGYSFLALRLTFLFGLLLTSLNTLPFNQNHFRLRQIRRPWLAL